MHDALRVTTPYKSRWCAVDQLTAGGGVGALCPVPGALQVGEGRPRRGHVQEHDGPQRPQPDWGPHERRAVAHPVRRHEARGAEGGEDFEFRAALL